MRVILHLGGDWRRAEKAAEVALELGDEFVIVVSSEGNESGFRKIYEDAGIPSEKVVVDETAWDTVTNFTHTRKLLSDLGASEIYVVTHDWHIPRAMGIANGVWFGRGVRLIPAPYIDGSSRDESRFAKADKLRAWVWRLTGVLFYYKNVVKSRGYQGSLGTENTWIEIELDRFSGILGFLGVYSG